MRRHIEDYLLLGTNLFLYFVDLATDLGRTVVCCRRTVAVLADENLACGDRTTDLRTLPVIFEESNHLVHNLNTGISAALGLADFLGVAAAFGDEVVHVEHRGQLVLTA